MVKVVDYGAIAGDAPEKVRSPAILVLFSKYDAASRAVRGARPRCCVCTFIRESLCTQQTAYENWILLSGWAARALPDSNFFGHRRPRGTCGCWYHRLCCAGFPCLPSRCCVDMRGTHKAHAQTTHMHTHTQIMRTKNGKTYFVASLLAASAAQAKSG